MTISFLVKHCMQNWPPIIISIIITLPFPFLSQSGSFQWKLPVLCPPHQVNSENSPIVTKLWGKCLYNWEEIKMTSCGLPPWKEQHITLSSLGDPLDQGNYCLPNAWQNNWPTPPMNREKELKIMGKQKHFCSIIACCVGHPNTSSSFGALWLFDC